MIIGILFKIRAIFMACLQLFWLEKRIVCLMFNFLSIAKPAHAIPSRWLQWYAM